MTPFEAYGHVMKEFVTVPDRLFRNTNQLRKYLDLSYEYIRTLRPKPTKKALIGRCALRSQVRSLALADE